MSARVKGFRLRKEDVERFGNAVGNDELRLSFGEMLMPFGSRALKARRIYRRAPRFKRMAAIQLSPSIVADVEAVIDDEFGVLLIEESS